MKELNENKKELSKDKDVLYKIVKLLNKESKYKDFDKINEKKFYKNKD